MSRSYSCSGFAALSLDAGVLAVDCGAVSSRGVEECARFARLRGGIVTVLCFGEDETIGGQRGELVKMHASLAKFCYRMVRAR